MHVIHVAFHRFHDRGRIPARPPQPVFAVSATLVQLDGVVAPEPGVAHHVEESKADHRLVSTGNSYAGPQVIVLLILGVSFVEAWGLNQHWRPTGL